MNQGTRILVALVVLLVIGTGIYWFLVGPSRTAPPREATDEVVEPPSADLEGAGAIPSRAGPRAPSDRPAVRDRGAERNEEASRRVEPDGRSPVLGGRRSEPDPPRSSEFDRPQELPDRLEGFEWRRTTGPAPSQENPPPGFGPAGAPAQAPGGGERGSDGESGSGATPPARGSDAPPTPPGSPPAAPPATTPEREPQPQRPAAPTAAGGGEHVVQEGDTLSGIAEAWFGDRSKWQLIVDANPGIDPNRLRVGQRVVLPPKTVVERSPAPQGPGGDHVVRAGESLYAIARDRLGDGARWRDIYDANRELIGADPTALKVGMRLRLPPR